MHISNDHRGPSWFIIKCYKLNIFSILSLIFYKKYGSCFKGGYILFQPNFPNSYAITNSYAFPQNVKYAKFVSYVFSWKLNVIWRNSIRTGFNPKYVSTLNFHKIISKNACEIIRQIDRCCKYPDNNDK